MLELKTEGMSCQSCVGAITKALKAVDPGAQVSVNIRNQMISVTSDEPVQVLTEAIEEAGYKVLSARTI